MMLATLLVLLLLLTCLTPAGLDTTYTIARRTWATVGLGVVLLGLMQDWWAMALWVLLCGNALTRPYPGMHLTRLNSLLVCYAVVALGRPFVTPDTIWLVLLALAVLPLLAWLANWLYGHPDDPLFQGQNNHADALIAISVASSGGLALAFSVWYLLLMPCVLPLIWLTGRSQPRIGQLAPWFAITALVPLAMVLPTTALSLAIAGAGVLSWKAKDLRMTMQGIDHGRVMMWSVLLLAGWWKAGWRVRLLGHGWLSWPSWADSFAMLQWKKAGRREQDYPTEGHFWSHPHSEYVSMLFEHGAVGLVLLLGWMGTLAVHAWHAGPMGQAVLIPAVMMSAIALTHFPWTFPTEKDFGSMGLVVVSVILALLLGGV